MYNNVRRKTLLAIVSFSLSLNVFPQELKVKIFEETPNDLTARTQEKLDVNGNACAIVNIFCNIDM